MNGFEIFPLAGSLVLTFLISGRICFLKSKGINLSSGSSARKKSQLFLYSIFLLILFLWMFEIAKPAFQFSFSVLPKSFSRFLVDSSFLKILGGLEITVALVLLTVALLHFKNSLRFGMDKTNQGELITTGIFSVSRNPFFLSLDLYFMGVAFVLPNLFFICFALLTLISIHFFILKEENFMLKIYGREYREYLRKVRRYI
jgi:protein-S-isoprenylcysteine O-methyltransferase Ste14